MTVTLIGMIDSSLVVAADEHRTYNTTWELKSDDGNDGPAQVIATVGLPFVGQAYTIGNDVDSDAFCHPFWRAKRKFPRDLSRWSAWLVEIPFSTKSYGMRQPTEQLGDPLVEAPLIHSRSSKQVKEAMQDKDGALLLNSAHQVIRGAAVEVPDDKGIVCVSQNVPALDLATNDAARNSVNTNPMWGMAARTIRLADFTFEKLFYGSGLKYFRLHHEFELNSDTWDRKIPDEGTKEFKGSGDRADPRDFIVVKDANDENTSILLDLNGDPWDGTTPASVLDTKNLLSETDFSTLGIPLDLNA